MTDQPEPPRASIRWIDVVNLHREFRVCRIAFVVALIGCYIFVAVAQGVEILRSLGEESTFKVLASGPLPAVKWSGIVLGALMWALASWYSCRVLLNFDFSADDRSNGPPNPWWEKWRLRVREHLPRVLGVVPLLIMAVGFWHASTTYDKHSSHSAPAWLRAYAAGCLLLAPALYVLFVYRLRLLGILPAGAPRFDPRQRVGRKFGDLGKGTRAALVATTVVSFVLLGLFSLNPILFAGALGSGAVLLFAAAGWVFWGGVCVYVFERFRVPLITFLLVWAAYCSLSNDNHVVRTSAPDGFHRPKLEEAFAAWRANAIKLSKEPVHPLFIVATEGGGIRAAYWTATLLGRLEDASVSEHRPDFAQHVFAISAVSGGSLGAAAFDAALAGGHAGPIRPGLRKMLGEDYLAAPLAALLYPDFVQRFVPGRYPSLDRGQWLERAWERGGKKHLGNDYFSRNFNDLWAGRDPKLGYLPALFLNGTSVETGQRIIASNIVIGNGFLDAIDACRKIAPCPREDCDIPLSTAAHNSARFTYVSPAGVFPDGTHVVDGGYFENSGATTALEILRAVKKIIRDGHLTDVHPYVIYISNDPLTGAGGGRDFEHDDPTVAPEEPKHPPSSFLEDTLAPVLAMAHTRGAHDSYAQLALREDQGYSSTEFFFFGLTRTAIPLPLGWKLSGTAAREMDAQADADPVDNPYEKIDGKNDAAKFRDVIELLE